MDKFNNVSVKIRKIKGKKALLAYASIVIDNQIMIESIGILQGKDGKFVVFPRKRMKNGKIYGIAYPIKNETRLYLQDKIIKEYEKNN